MPHHAQQAAQQLADDRVAPRPMKESGACQDGDDRLEYIGQDDQQNLLLAEDPIEVGQTGVAAAVVADVIPQDVFGDDDRGVAAAQQIRGRHGDQHRCDQMPIHHRSPFSPLARMMSRMGVPSRPKVLRIWFSRYRW